MLYKFDLCFHKWFIHQKNRFGNFFQTIYFVLAISLKFIIFIVKRIIVTFINYSVIYVIVHLGRCYYIRFLKYFHRVSHD